MNAISTVNGRAVCALPLVSYIRSELSSPKLATAISSSMVNRAMAKLYQTG
jgi:hypothetical protein